MVASSSLSSLMPLDAKALVAEGPVLALYIHRGFGSVRRRPQPQQPCGG